MGSRGIILNYSSLLLLLPLLSSCALTTKKAHGSQRLEAGSPIQHGARRGCKLHNAEGGGMGYGQGSSDGTGRGAAGNYAGGGTRGRLRGMPQLWRPTDLHQTSHCHTDPRSCADPKGGSEPQGDTTDPRRPLTGRSSAAQNRTEAGVQPPRLWPLCTSQLGAACFLLHFL